LIIDFNFANFILETSMYLSDQARNAFFAQILDRDSSLATLSAIEHSQQNLQSDLSGMVSDFERFKQRDNRRHLRMVCKVRDMYNKVSELERNCKSLQTAIDCQNKTIESLQSIVTVQQPAPVKPSAKQ
jgi:predicted acetyltransferase